MKLQNQNSFVIYQTALAVINLGSYNELKDVTKQAIDKHAHIKTTIYREIISHTSTKAQGKLY